MVVKRYIILLTEPPRSEALDVSVKRTFEPFRQSQSQDEML